MNYILVDGDLIKSFGRCQREFAPAGAIEVNELPQANDFKLYWRGGKYVYTTEPAFEPTVQMTRMASYPSVGDQLDMLWHAMDSGVMAKVEPWYSTIKAVKDANPK